LPTPKHVDARDQPGHDKHWVLDGNIALTHSYAGMTRIRFEGSSRPGTSQPRCGSPW
jgi:hypothetical protein